MNGWRLTKLLGQCQDLFVADSRKITSEVIFILSEIEDSPLKSSRTNFVKQINVEMIYFKHIVLKQIKSATDENELKNVIRDSIQRLKTKNINGHLIHRFILSMNYTLHRESAKNATSKVQQNMELAIEHFKKISPGTKLFLLT